MSHKKSRKHDTTRGGGGVNLSLIITPMLDMAFQLIAFFIMTYNPPSYEGRIDGQLLPGKPLLKGPAKAEANKDLLSIDEEPKYNDSLQVIIKAVDRGRVENGRSDGAPRALEIKRPEAAAPITISGGDGLPPEAFVKDLESELERELKRLLKDPNNKSMDIKLEGDPNLRYRYLMRFYDVCKQAGVQNIHFVAPVFERK